MFAISALSHSVISHSSVVRAMIDELVIQRLLVQIPPRTEWWFFALPVWKNLEELHLWTYSILLILGIHFLVKFSWVSFLVFGQTANLNHAKSNKFSWAKMYSTLIALQFILMRSVKFCFVYRHQYVAKISLTLEEDERFWRKVMTFSSSCCKVLKKMTLQ